MPPRTGQGGTDDRSMPAADPGQEFERVVRDAMDREDLSLVALARATGIDRGRWYTWFRGENAPQPRTLIRAAPILKLTVDDLMSPWGGLPPRSGTVTDPGLGALTDAINRLADVLGGNVDELAAEVAEGTRRARARAGGASRPPARTPR